jgi:hypothetical protein
MIEEHSLNESFNEQLSPEKVQQKKCHQKSDQPRLEEANSIIYENKNSNINLTLAFRHQVGLHRRVSQSIEQRNIL